MCINNINLRIGLYYLVKFGNVACNKIIIEEVTY